eukprot:TRINITY_DN38130_c0_g1_i1.p1 TRINITY_DN38130_c0_g1~~TRINITY_DN38130_c0_g1_i1.p1  ORF type:complete len:232 (+),score=40.59 TRINITY_DN38130_c0_g1_i1:64-696(+)
MVDRTLDELILEDGSGRRGRKGKGGGGGSRSSGPGAGKSGEKCPWDTKVVEGVDGQAFWLHDDRAGGAPVEDADAPWMKGKGKGKKPKEDAWGPVRKGKGGGGGRSNPYDRGGSEGKWRHDMFDGSDDMYSYSGWYGKGKQEMFDAMMAEKYAYMYDMGKGKGKRTMPKANVNSKWKHDMFEGGDLDDEYSRSGLMGRSGQRKGRNKGSW